MTTPDSTNTNSDQSEIENLVNDYFDSLEQQVDTDQLEETENQINDWENRREKLVKEHGDDHYLVEKASSAISTLEEEREELINTSENVDDTRHDFLKAIVEDPGFEFSEQWLQPNTIKAVNHALYGIKDKSFTIREHEIQNVSDLSEYDEFDKIEMEHIIVSLAKDRLNGNETIEDLWERLTNSVGYPAIEVLANNGKMSPSNVASILDEDSRTVLDRLRNFTKWDEFIPVYRPESGMYSLSTTGKYLMNNKSDVPTSKVEAQKEDQESTDNSDSKASESGHPGSQKTQTKLEQPKQHSTYNVETDDEKSDTPESTEEKAKQMFSDIGENGGEE